MSASVPPQHAPTPDGVTFGQGRFVLGNSGSLLDTIVAYSRAQPAMVAITIFLLAFVIYQAVGTKASKLPVVNPQPFGWKFTLSHADRLKLAAGTKHNLISGRQKYGPDQVFKVNGIVGELIVLPPRFISEIRNEQDLLPQDPDETSHANIPGFEAFQGVTTMLAPVVNKYITKVLGKLTKMLSNESAVALTENLGESTEWREIKPTHELLPVVSRVSTRVFMGEEMCDNKEWLRVSTEYTMRVFALIGDLLAYPNNFTRRVINPFLPRCRELRASLDRCRKTLQPLIDDRRKAVAEARRLGEQVPTWEDSIEWFRREYGEVDFATKQIQMSMVAIHTTTDLLAETMVRIARHPEHLPALREEVIRVISAEGWKKTAMYNLRFMDSFIKEAQRLRPALLSTMQRTVGKDHTLSNGVRLKKGQMVIADVTHMWDSAYYEDPLTFDPYRFLRMRGTDKDAMAQLASTSEAHTGFGHGMHACPGRFFAANEIKILLCQILLKYDWKLAGDQAREPEHIFLDLQIFLDPQISLLIRKREPEVDLDSIEG